MKIDILLNTLKELKDKDIDIADLYVLREILWDYNGKDKDTMWEMLQYTTNLWLHSETKIDPCDIAYKVVEKWDEIKENKHDRDLELDILCEIEEW